MTWRDVVVFINGAATGAFTVVMYVLWIGWRERKRL